MRKSIHWAIALASAAAILLFVTLGPAPAADVAPVYKNRGEAQSITPVMSWTGLYAGVTWGYGWKDENFRIIPGNSSSQQLQTQGLVASNQNSNPSGQLLGIIGGYDFQVNPWFVIGITADWSKSWMRSSSYSGGNLAGLASDEKIKSFGTVRGRAGIPIGNLLVFGSVGWAWADVNTTFTPSGLACAPGAAVCNGGASSEVKNGWVWGGGAEYRLDRNWSLMAEALFARLGTQSTLITASAKTGKTVTNFSWSADQDVNIGIVRMALTRRF